MKNLKIILVAFLLFQLSSSNAQSHDTALEYLSFVGKNQLTITKSIWSYTKAIAHSKSDKNIGRKRTALIKTLDNAISKIQ